MDQFLTYTILGLVTGALYAVAASGLVVTYTTSGVFNFAHGAFGMFAAFAYWQLRVDWGWPAPIALLVVLGILAPAFGAGIERVVMRGLVNVTEATKLVVSVSLLFGVFQLAMMLFPSGTGRRMPGFFEGNTINLGVYDMSWHELIIIAAAIATAAGLRFVLFGTRAGVAMRGVVDDRDLAQLNGSRPGRASMTAWALGSMLAALSGILLAGSQGALGHLALTLLVINAYAAAMFGRLRSLPMTFIGAMFLGLAQSYAIGYINVSTPVRSIAGFSIDPALSLNGLRTAIPVIVLFVVLLFLPPLRVRAGAAQKSREIIPSPGVARWLIGTVVLAAGAWAIGPHISDGRVGHVGQGLALGIVMLSLVPLIGYAGQISLAPMAFAGIGAVVMGAWGGDGSPLGLIAAIAVSALAGALVALPAIRLQGLYLALATAAFAVLMDQLVFNQGLFIPNGRLSVPRLDIFGISFDDPRAHLVLIAVAFGLVAALLAWIRERPFGRRLLAMKSSEAACATLGVDLRATKLAVFTLSAGIAGFGGALYAAHLSSSSPQTFQFLQSLPVVLLAVVGGIAAPGGALFGGLVYALMFMIIPDLYPSLRNLLALTPALAGISLGRNPNGAVNETVTRLRDMARARSQRRATPSTPVPVMAEDLGLDGFTAADLALLDREMGLDAEPLYGALPRRTASSAGSAP